MIDNGLIHASGIRIVLKGQNDPISIPANGGPVSYLYFTDLDSNPIEPVYEAGGLDTPAGPLSGVKIMLPIGSGAGPYNANPEDVAEFPAPGDSSAYSRGNHKHAHGDQPANATMHALAGVDGHPGFMTVAHKDMLDDASSTPGSGRIVLWANEAGVFGVYGDFFATSVANKATEGVVRCVANSVGLAFRKGDATSNSVHGISCQGDDTVRIGDNSHCASTRRDCLSGGSHSDVVNGSVIARVDADGLDVSGGSIYARDNITGSSPASRAEAYLVHGFARSTGDTPFELFGSDMLATGESLAIEAKILCHTEGTHAASARFRIDGLFQRTSSGVSSRLSISAGDQTSSGNSFAATRPSVALSDPASGVAPNVLDRGAIIATGKAATNILWEYWILRQRGRVS